MGSGLDGIHRGLGSAFGIALGSAVLELRTTVHVLDLGEQQGASMLSVPNASTALARLLAWAGEFGGIGGGKPLAVLREHLLQRAQLAAYQDTFVILCGVTLLALVPALLARERRDVLGKPSAG
jgi:hypothetical protein